MLRSSDPTIADNCHRFHELAGSAVEWLTFFISHCELYLRVTGTSRGRALIHFIGLRYADGPIKLHSVRLRLATELEWEAVRLRLPPDDVGLVGRDDCLVIQGTEGRALIVADLMHVHWEDEG